MPALYKHFSSRPSILSLARDQQGEQRRCLQPRVQRQPFPSTLSSFLCRWRTNKQNAAFGRAHVPLLSPQARPRPGHEATRSSRGTRPERVKERKGSCSWRQVCDSASRTKRRPGETRRPRAAHSRGSRRYAKAPQRAGPPPLRHWLGPRAFANMALRTAAGLRCNLACSVAPPRRRARIGGGRKPGC